MNFRKFENIFLYLLLSISGCSGISTIKDNNFQRFENIKSWKEIRYDGVVEQSLDYSCGAASVATILKYYYGREISESDVNDHLPKERATFFELSKATSSLSEDSIGLYVNKAKLLDLKIPAIAHIVTPFANNHFVVIRGIGPDDTMLLADPSVGNIRIDLESFYEMWLTESGEKGKILIIKSERQPNRDYFSKSAYQHSTTDIVFPTDFHHLHSKIPQNYRLD